MDLRERTVYFKWSTYADLLHSGELAAVVAGLESLLGAGFTLAQDLGVGRKQRRLSPTSDVASVLSRHVGAGVHVSGRFKLSQAPSDPNLGEETLEVFSGAHPYSGRFRVALDARVSRHRFEAPEFVERFVDWVRAMVTSTRPFMAHAHETDDNAIQNISVPRLLKSGFGVDAQGPITLLDNPGVEISRGEFRHVVNWLTVLGPAMIDQLGVDAVRSAPCPAEVLGVDEEHLMLRLYRSPLEAAVDANRTRQAETREALGFMPLVQAQGPTMGYWNHRSWKQ